MMKKMAHVASLAALVSLGACSSASSTEEPIAEAASALGVGPTLIAEPGDVTGLRSSTGNLYYTSVTNGGDILAPNPSVWRTGKTSTPGSEFLLYQETTSIGDPAYFGSITWALVGGSYYAYFVANYGVLGSGGRSLIKQIPLAGLSSTATVLNTSPVNLPYIGNNDLETDGTSLYWTDANGLEKMPIGGGAVATIVAGSLGPRLSLSGSTVYFSEGAGIYEFYRQRLVNYVMHVAQAPATVTSLYYDAPSNTLYWGESGGGVRRAVALLGSTQFTFQTPTTGHTIPDVGFDGTNVLWLDCDPAAFPPGYGCEVQSYTGGTLTTVQSNGNGSPTLQWDSTSMYWGDWELYGYVH
jgi:hypothetical protein